MTVPGEQTAILRFAQAGQFVGTSMYGVCTIALSILILRETGSFSAYGGNVVIAAAGTALFGPLAGLLIQRIGRAMLTIAVSAGVLLAATATLLAATSGADVLPWSLLLTLACSIQCSAMAVMSISLPRLLEERGIDLSGGLARIQLAEQSARVLSPLLLVVFVPLNLIQIAVILQLLGAWTLLLGLRRWRLISSLERRVESSPAEKASRVSARDMLAILRQDRTIRIFAPYLAVSTACVEVAAIALAPVVVSFAGEAMFGLSMTIANISAVCGSIAVRWLQPFWSRAFAIRLFLAIEFAGGILIAIESQTQSVVVYTMALAAGFFIMPASLVAAQYVWLGGASRQRQGILSGLERTSSWLLVPFAYATAPFWIPQGASALSEAAVDALRMVGLAAALALAGSTVIAWFLLGGTRLGTRTAEQEAR